MGLLVTWAGLVVTSVVKQAPTLRKDNPETLVKDSQSSQSIKILGNLAFYRRDLAYGPSEIVAGLFPTLKIDVGPCQFWSTSGALSPYLKTIA